jgi:hypothetical protein
LITNQTLSALCAFFAPSALNQKLKSVNAALE